MNAAAARFAVLSDIHGNIWALEAVLADASRRAISRIVDLGDSLDGPLEPRATADRLLQGGIPSIRGNGERLLLSPVTGATPRSVARCRAVLASEHLAWLAALPSVRSIDGILFCHGTPLADDVYLLEDAPPTGQRLRPVEGIAQLLAGTAERLVLCGHSHVPRVVELPGGQLVVNPGSVGLPAYRGEEPPHVMETGSSHARYAIVEHQGDGWTVELVAVPYDFESAVRRARENGREDWTGWLAGRG